jgi:hypothetical protein
MHPLSEDAAELLGFIPGASASIPSRDPDHSEILCGLSQSLKANSGMIPSNTPRSCHPIELDTLLI